MTDHIPADKLREVLDEYRTQMPCQIEEALTGLLPTPPLPTLADMTPEEREKCQWIWGKTKTGRIVLIGLISGDRCKCHFPDGGHSFFGLDYITPLPDLPKMQWPGSESDDGGQVPSTEETPPAETVDNPSSTTPRNPDPQPGEAWELELSDGTFLNAIWSEEPIYPWITLSPYDSTEPDQLAGGFHPNKKIVGRRRLVPETPRKTLVAVEDYAGAAWETVVKGECGLAREKRGHDQWFNTDGVRFTDVEMAGTTRTVLWEPAS